MGIRTNGHRTTGYRTIGYQTNGPLTIGPRKSGHRTNNDAHFVFEVITIKEYKVISLLFTFRNLRRQLYNLNFAIHNLT